MSLTKIKNHLKKNFSNDIVLIQCGCFYEAYEEDASFLENDKSFRFKTFIKGRNLLTTGIHINNVKKFSKKLEILGLNYVFVSQISSANSFYRISNISNKSDCLGIKFFKNGSVITEGKNIAQNKGITDVNLESQTEILPSPIVPQWKSNLKEVNKKQLSASNGMPLDPYQARRVALYIGSIQFPAYLEKKKIDFLSFIGSLKSLPKRDSELKEIFQAAVLDQYDETGLGRKQLQWLSNILEKELEDDSFFNQYMNLIRDSTSQTKVELHSVNKGKTSFNKGRALYVFFDMTQSDLRKNEDKYEWIASDDSGDSIFIGKMSEEKAIILKTLRKFHGLNFEESLKMFDEI